MLIALLAAFNLVGIFSLFFLIPLLRAPVVWWNNKKQHSNNIRRRLYRAIFGTNDESITRNDVVERANRIATTEEKLRIADIEELLGETLRDVGGDQSVTESGDLAADLTHLQIEEQAAEEHALEERKAKVIYQTD